MQKEYEKPITEWRTMEENQHKRICTNQCIFYIPAEERCSKLQLKVSPVPKQGYKLIRDCREYRNGWTPDYQKHVCKNPKCEGKPMGILTEQWGSKLLSVMYKCGKCGRIDGEIWDINEKKLLIENVYMKSRYGDEEDLIDSLSNGGSF